MIEHFKKLLKYEVLDETIWHSQLKGKYEHWQKRRGNYDDYMIDLAEAYITSLIGMEQKKMEFVTDQLVALQGDKVYMCTRDRIKWHQDNNHLVFFVSGAPEYLVHKMAIKYGISDYVGSKYIMDANERFTGEVIRMWDSESKKRAILELTDKYAIDLNVSYAYGDTHGDITMFELVGNPVAINPTQELLTAIRQNTKLNNTTQILVERKDVIYLLTPNTHTLR
jgi:HAD superfamily hydrolase (TIGR01490 family)